MKRKVFFFFFSLAILCSAAFFLRFQILTLCTKFALAKTFPQNLTYRELYPKEQKIQIHGLSFSSEDCEVTLDELEFEIQWQKIFQNPKGLFRIFRNHAISAFDLLHASKEYGLNLNIPSGALSLDANRYSFEFKYGEKKHEIGTLVVSQNPGPSQHPFLTIKFQVRGDQLVSQMVVEETAVENFLPLANLVVPQIFSGFVHPNGMMQCGAHVIFSEEGKIEEFSTRFRTENFSIEAPEKDLAIQLDHLSGEIFFPEENKGENLPFWKRMHCHFVLQNAALGWREKLFLSHLEGNLSLDPNEPPAISLTGELAGQEKPLFLEVKGNRALQEDQLDWLEFVLDLNDYKGTQCGGFVSLCSPEQDALVVQLEARNLLPQQVEMLKDYLSYSMPRLKEWSIAEGSFGGKLVAFFEKGNLSHFEVQNFEANDVFLSSSSSDPLHLSYIKGEGRLFSELHFDMELSTPDFFGLLSPQLKNAYADFSQNDRVLMSTHLQFGATEVQTSASVAFLTLDESMQFGFKSQRPFPTSFCEMSEGWARSEKLSHFFYGPLVSLVNEDLEIYGKVDLMASYDGKMIDCALQVDDFVAKHPAVDFQAQAIGEKDKTVGRMKFRYDPLAHHFEGMIPLRGARGYDRKFGLFFDKLDCDLQVTPKKLTGHVAHADVSYDSVELIRNLDLYFSYDQVFDFHEIRADLALPSSHRYNVHFPHFSSTSCEGTLYDEKLKLAHFKGENLGRWKGSIALPLLQKSFPTLFSWDPILQTASLEMEGEDFALSLKKERGTILLEKVKAGSVSGRAELSFEKGRVQFSTLQLQSEKGSFSGSGQCAACLPNTGKSFGIYGDLEGKVETQVPIPIQLQGNQKIKWAFGPEMGLVFSGIDFSEKGCSIQIDHLEHHRTSDKLTARGIQLFLSQEWMSKIFESAGPFSILQDLQICRELQAVANLEFEKGKTKAKGLFQSASKNLQVDLEWDGEKGHLALGEEKQLTLKAHRAQDTLCFDSIKGSLGSFRADLKKIGRENKLKGAIQVDFSFFDRVFDTPLHEFIQLWHARGGYEFEGVFTTAPRLFDWGFKGKCKGKNFQCAGYQLNSLEAKIDIKPGEMTVENLDFTDDAGKLWLGEGTLTRVQNGKWIFSFPLVEIRSFQPSLLRTLSGPERPITPLILKSATLINLRGRLDDPDTITGQGNLRFLNQSKKGEKKLPSNLPVQVLDRLGLDGCLFVPASGDMHYTIQNRRIYLSGIHNMVSEKNLSEFFPPKNGAMGYLDFQGNLFIDFIVRQKALRSLSAPLSYKVRGSWKDPQIMIQ